MRHRVATRRLGRPTDQRIAILKSLVAAVIEHGHVTTTEARAKEVRPIIEKVITLAREAALNPDTALNNRRAARRWIPTGQPVTTKEKYENVTGEALPYKLTPKQPGQRPRGLKAPERVPKGERLLHKLFTEIGERMQDRTGGYLRVTKLGGESHLTGKGKTIIRPARRGDGASMVKIEIVD